MVVQHNMQAMNANRMLSITTKNLSSSTEKLSSGYKINRAADNAAGLSISEKMRKQIRGLTQASVNSEAGISSVQTAEGALQEVTDMLQRMNELSVQAANGTNSITDRQYIQDELDQLVSEIDRVAETTKFNDIYLLKGDTANGTSNQYTAQYKVTNAINHVSNAPENILAPKTKVKYTGTNNVYIVDESITSGSPTDTFTAATIGNGSDITRYMQRDDMGKEYSYSMIRANDAASISHTTNTDVTYKNTPTSLTPTIFANGTLDGTTMGSTSTSFYAATSPSTTSTNTILSQVNVSFGSDGRPVFSWKDTAPKYYNNAAVNTAGSYGEQNTGLITDAQINSILQYELAQNHITVATTAGLHASAADSDTTPLTPEQLKSYFDPTTNGGYYKKAYAYVTTPGDANFGKKIEVGAEKIDTYLTITNTSVTSGIYTDVAGGDTNLLKEEDISNYFDDRGKYTGGLYAYKGATLTEIPVNGTADFNIDNYINTTVTSVDSANPNPYNKAKVAFNTDDYKAFVRVEMDSNTPRLLGPNGTTDLYKDINDNNKVKANKTLYIYNSETKAMTHLEAGSDMSAYLNDDNTLKEKYMLMDILYGNSITQQTSDRVRNQMTNGNDFVWNDAVIDNIKARQTLYDGNGKEIADMALGNFFDDKGNYTGGLYTTKQARVIDQVFTDEASSDEVNALISSGINVNRISDFLSVTSKEVSNELSFSLQVGADSMEENQIKVNIKSLTAAGLGVDKIHSSLIGIVDETGANATQAINVIAEAIQKISTERSKLGAIQNRLEHTIKNLDNVVENTTYAESRIRDTDMAKEMVNYSNTNILSQAGQSMLAQSNQANQGILSIMG